MKTILVIEDNSDIRESTAEILAMSGYKVITAENGKSGVKTAIRQRPDLILCDIMMPELDGYGVLNILNKSPYTATIPFIFLTAKTGKPDLRKGMAMGADDYLTKPFDDKELLHAINCRLQKQENLKTFYSRSLTSLQRLASEHVLGSDELKRLIAERKVRQLKKKHILYYEGDNPEGIYLVLEGFVKTFKLVEDGRELVTGLYKAEEYVGINELFTDKHVDTAEAIDDSVVCLLPKDMIMDLISQYPDISQQFMRILCNNIREKEEQLLQFAYSSVRNRMLQVLLRLQSQFPDHNDFKISRDELAAMAGMATETVSRTLSDFKEEGLIERKGSHIRILDAINFAKARH
ncbi:response regulator [Mucilaginibacter sp. P25]|uniref:cAMP-binding domain of CRP or a regulatory subunit of cAMP-dependent protein kinases n=1 Tax=Mucilaginibacter gossypii TaxID=551996 RepID=A0A1G7U427_9SPHI|nr:response regulator [Mucilaginibacter gossypii]SDG42213.1 cAMP-binding domain of CRP or a regulatory subunit of cAMP-dependent protein kinases [Mucilaginibacter gossypii]